MDIRLLSHENFTFRYSVQGHGQPLVFVGGAFQAIDKLGPLAEHWEKHYQLILIELPGFGDSDFLPAEYSFDFTASCIEKVMDLLEVQDAIMVGTSYGSPSVYRYVGQHQSRVKAMVLGGSCTAIDKFMEYQIRTMLKIINSDQRETFPQAFTEVMCNTHIKSIPNASRIHQILKRSLSRLNDAARAKFAANSLRLIGAKLPDYKITVPTLVFTGEHDRFTPAKRLSEFSQFCQDLRIVWLPDADHMYHLEQTEKTLSLIDGFVHAVSQGAIRAAS